MPSKRFWRTDDKPPPYSRTQQHQRQQQSTSDNDPKDIALQDRGPTASSSSEPDVLSPVGTAQSQQALSNNGSGAGGYRTYKRRWFGLVQMTLMNIVVSWGWLTYAPVASHAATYYSVRESSINWLSTAFFLSFVVISPLVLLALHHPSGLRISLSTAALLVLIGNWVRYAGATERSDTGGSTETSGRNGYALAMAGEILIGFAQPFVLAAPTRYSDLWFTARGRVAATAVMSLANPLGAALGQLINPFWVSDPRDVSDMVLYVSIISTVASIPCFFIPPHPPTPVGPSSTTPKLRLRASLPALRSLELWLILIPFWVYVGFFNSLSSLLNQMLTPYGLSDDEAGIGGAVLIVVGLLTAAVTSPIIDRTKKFLLAIKIFIPIIAGSYLVFTWMPETKAIPGPYVILALLGASSFALVPVALECLIELSHPLNPAVTSTFAWAGGQLLGAIFVLVSDALVEPEDASPPKNMKRALIFQAVVALVVAPLPMVLGLFGRQKMVELRRVRSDEAGAAQHVEEA